MGEKEGNKRIFKTDLTGPPSRLFGHKDREQLENLVKGKHIYVSMVVDNVVSTFNCDSAIVDSTYFSVRCYGETIEPSPG